MVVTRHILISGRVQGVGYRFFTQREAQDVGAVGWVRNLDDGRVEALVQVDETLFKGLIVRLQKGPSRASVEKIEVKAVSGAKVMEEFVIEKDGDSPWQGK